MKNFTKSLLLTVMTLFIGASTTLAQFGCGSAVSLTNGYTATGITTPGTGGAEDWNTNPTGTSINTSYWDDDVYLFEYTAGGSAEQISMTINSNNTWNGIGIFDDCTGTTFSTELDAVGSSATGLRTVSTMVAAGNTVYIALGQWGTPNDLDFDVVSFTASSCLAPSALTATNVTTTTADIGWTENGSATAWNIEYGAAGFTPTGTPTITGTTNNPESLTGLMSATDYEFYVQADCGGSGTSSWVGPFSFTTPCATFTPVYTEDFTSYVPSCWEEAQGLLTASSTLTAGTSDWANDGFGNNGSTGAAKMNIYTTGQEEWLISPSIDLTGGPFQLKYDVALTAYANTSATTFDSDDSLAVVISTDNGATWSNTNILRTYTAGSEPPNTGDLAIIDLSAYTGVVQIGFYATSSAGGGVDNDVFIDNFIVEPIPLCQQVSGITATNVAATSLDLGWTENGSATTWNIEYGTAGFTPTGTPTIAGTVNNPEAITGLVGNTSYDFYVQADCAGNGTSVWTGPYTVTTPCDIYVPDYSEDFTNYVPGCWEEATGALTSSSTLALGSSSWASDGFANNGTSGAARMNIYTTGQDEWLISPSIDLTGGPFQLEYDVALTEYAGTAATTMDADDSLVVVISTDNGATWSNTNILQVYTDGSEPSNTGQREYIDLSAYTGIVKFGFYAASTQNLTVDNDISIDNFLVTSLCLPTTGTDVQTACDSYTWIDGNTYTTSNNTATFVLTNANVNGCDSIVELDLTINTTPVVTTTTNGAEITADANGVSYQWLDCANGNAVVAGETTQTFVAAVSGNYAVEVSDNGCVDTSACEAVTVSLADLIITEINYNGPESGTDSTEFIEVYNNSAATVNMSGFTFSQGVTYTAGPNTLVSAGGYIVFAVDSLAIINVYGYTGAYEFTGGLSNAGEDITIVDANGVTIDSVDYNDGGVWPSGFAAGEPDGGGASLILCDYSTDNNVGTNWSVATTATGTNINGFDVFGSPGAVNSCLNVCPSAFAITACDSYTVPSGDETYTSSGSYMDTIVGSAGCDSIVTITLTINSSSTGTDVITACDSYSWIDGNTYTASNNTATFVLTNAAGCDSTVTLDLTINSSSTGTDVQTACDSYTWIDGNTYTASNNTATFILTNAAGCDSTVTLDLTINTVDVTVNTNDPSIAASATGATYVWLDCDNGYAPIAGETGQVFTATTNGNYAVQVTENGCVDTSACTPIVTVSLDDQDPLTGIAVYPNPVKNTVYVEMGSLESATITLLDINGKILFVDESVENSLYTFEMNQAPGIYFVEVRANNSVKQFKLVKQ